MRDFNDQPVEAPDYGLSVRYRYGGTAIPGVDVSRSDGLDLPLAYIPAGATSTVLHLRLNPAFLSRPDALLQLQFLSADSGYAVDDMAAVVSLIPAGGKPRALDGTPSSFVPGALLEPIPNTSMSVVEPLAGPAAVLQGRVGQVDHFVVRPGGGLPHISGFRPQEGDRILIDPITLQRLRQDPAHRQFSDAARAQALESLTQQVGADPLQSYQPDELKKLSLIHI